MNGWKKMATIQRISVPALDDILGEQIQVLDKGFVRVVDYMGDDSAICQAARQSYGAGTKSVSEDRGLIRYLQSGGYEMKVKHSSPFEMCEIKFHIRLPMDAWRQGVRHRTMSVNEYSTRYSEAIDDKQTTKDDEWRSQSSDNKQGSGDFLSEEVGHLLSVSEVEFHELAAKLYRERLDKGVAREQARKDLPLSTYTEAYIKVDLHNLLHFLLLRMDHHAQLEIRSYANVIGDIVAKWVPYTWGAFQDYVVNAVTFSAQEMKIIKAIMDQGVLNEPSIPEMEEFKLLNKREKEAFIAKIK